MKTGTKRRSTLLSFPIPNSFNLLATAIQSEFGARPINAEQLAGQVLLGGRPVDGQGFTEHLLGLNRKRPSRAPGMDFDITDQTENLSSDHKPKVLTPVSGKVKFIGEHWGSVRIVDEAGYSHVLLHIQLSERPIGGSTTILKVGDMVKFGDVIGILSNLGTDRDHVHYYVQDPGGVFIDPANLVRNLDGSVVGVQNYDKYLEDLRWMEFQHQRYEPGRQPTLYDNTNPADVGGVA